MRSHRGTLVFHHNGIGDYVMSLPALRLIAEHAPRPLHLVHGDGPAAFLYDELAVDERTAMPMSPGHYAHRFDAHAVPLARRYDVFVSLPTWTGPELPILAARARAAARLGFFSWCSLQPQAPPDAHDVERLFSLALTFRPSAQLADYARPPDALRRPPTGGETRRQRRLVVHTDTRAEKMLPWATLDDVLPAFVDAFEDWRVVVLNAGPERLPRSSVCERVEMPGGLPLDTAMSLVGSADAFLGVDSCMLHVADAHRVPTLALFGPTRCEQFGPLFGAACSTSLQVDGAVSRLRAGTVFDALCHVMHGLPCPSPIVS